jgi:CheY-like chemotaxis protein
MILREIAAEAPGEGAAETRVLVVDDDPTSRLLAGAALKDQMSVVEAENGVVALDALERQAFDITILDLDMPVMDGFAVIERARARPETRYLPIIVVTGREDVVSIERAFALGATSFLCKPINWAVFRHQVDYVLKVARVERKLRATNRELERLTVLRARGLAALEREVEEATGIIARLPSDGSAAFQEVAAAGERLRNTLERVNRASDILTGAAGFAQRIVSAKDLAAAAVDAVKGAAGSESADRIVVSAPEPLEVLCDEDLVSDALVEVLRNAITASPPKEKVELRIVHASPDRVRFEIKDQGSGIPEYRLESGIAELASGQASGVRPGLGLVLAKAIVEQHGGHFGIMSEPGQGTEVFLSLPAAAERKGRPSVNRAAQIAS